jgi:hypothetical protein
LRTAIGRRAAAIFPFTSALPFAFRARHAGEARTLFGDLVPAR